MKAASFSNSGVVPELGRKPRGIVYFRPLPYNPHYSTVYGNSIIGQYRLFLKIPLAIH
jgi:hypothetical protein